MAPETNNDAGSSGDASNDEAEIVKMARLLYSAIEQAEISGQPWMSPLEAEWDIREVVIDGQFDLIAAARFLKANLR